MCTFTSPYSNQLQQTEAFVMCAACQPDWLITLGYQDVTMTGSVSAMYLTYYIAPPDYQVYSSHFEIVKNKVQVAPGMDVEYKERKPTQSDNNWLYFLKHTFIGKMFQILQEYCEL